MADTIVDDAEWDAFHDAVNMSSRELREWLGIDADPDVAARADPDDRELGHRVLEILGRRRTDLTADDVEVMGHVTARIERLRSEQPEEPSAGDSRHRHRLMSLGHDPLKG